jgi:hypothetical protein
MSFGMHGGKEKCTEGAGGHTWNKQTSLKTMDLMEE